MTSSAGRQAEPEATVATRRNGYLALELYAAIGDGRSVAIVGADGSIDWLAVPAMDSVPLFDRLLDPERGGRFSITPEGDFTVERSYRHDSNVLEQVFVTPTGRARLTDSLNDGIAGRLPWCELARRVEGLDGTVTFHIEIRVGRRLDGATPWREPTRHGTVLHLAGIIAAVRTDSSIERLVDDDERLVARLVTKPGSRTTLAILASDDEPLILEPLETIDRRIERSDRAWSEWCDALTVRGRFAAEVKRSALALKLLLYSPTGAIAAAATTSLPERIGGSKNYDYRYAWVRDICYTIKAFIRVGGVGEAKAAFSWLTATIKRHDGLRIMYRLDGRIAPEQEELDLPGYRGSRPVLQGNKARTQLQLGVYGDILEAAALFVEHGHVLDLATRKLLAVLVDRCADIWRKKDTGIWELEDVQHYTISKIGCWMALERGARLAQQGQIESTQSARWDRERERIARWIDEHCWSEAKQAYTLHAGTDRLDASLLLAAQFGFDRRERLAKTRDAVRRELSRGPLVYRYGGMEREEGTFTCCGFWMVEALALLGEKDAALRQMKDMLAATGGNLGLLTEQMDPDTGAALGNLPQALSHLALIHAAEALERD